MMQPSRPLCVILRSVSLLVFLSLASTTWGKVVYVNKNAPGPAGDGATWSTAVLTVTAGLSAAAAGDEVWVAAASYAEDVTLKRGVALYGGFAGAETSRDARNPTSNVTTLEGTRTTSVVTVPASAGKGTLIDGFTITHGRGTFVIDSTGGKGVMGGGVYCLGSAVITNNVLTGNAVYGPTSACGGSGQYQCLSGVGRGGGIYCAQGDPVIHHNVIQENYAETEGGGIYCGSGSPQIDANVISGNNAYSLRGTGAFPGDGAGICCTGSDAVITRNTIQSNGLGFGSDRGGGICLYGGHPTVSGNSITANGYAGSGSAVYMSGGVCSGNLISGGRAVKGGGVYAAGSSSVVGNVIDANQGEGAGVYAETGASVVSNLITNNISASTGGGCLASGAEVINNTFVKNTAVNGGALALGAASVVANNVVVNNSSGVYSAKEPAGALTPYVRNNDVFANPGYAYGGVLPDLTGTQGNTSVDPLFADAAAGDYRLLAGSPCIDAGDGSASFVPTDLDGKPRIWGTTVDMGAYEFAPVAVRRVIHVSARAPGSPADGVTWITAFHTVQAGIDAANGGDEVWVAASTYEEKITLKDGVSVYGGFAGSESARGQRDPAANTAVLDAMGTGTVVTVPASAVAGVRLDGFTVRNGSDSGIRVLGNAVLARDTVKSNVASIGAGIRVEGTAAVQDCLIQGNTAAGQGGGLAVCGNATVTNATITGNSASSGGGLAVVGAGSVQVVNTIVASNLSGIDGSGGTVLVRNCDVFDNGEADFVGLADPTGTSGNIARDPLFADRAADFRLLSGSPCIDAGDDSVLVPGGWDVEGKDRLMQAHVDLGAYEYRAAASPARILRVNRNAGGDVRDGATWETAFHSVEDGIIAARAGDEVWVAASAPAWPAYVELVTLKNGQAMYGGFAGTESRRAQRDPKTHATVLDGNAWSTVVTVPSSVTEAATLDGFTVRNGYLYYSEDGGAGIFVAGNAVISNNTITANRVDGSGDPLGWDGVGGGVAVTGSAVITGNTITGNIAYRSGGGIRVKGGTSTITNNVINGNHAGFHGAAVLADTHAITIAGNVISNNTSCDWPVYVTSGTADVRNNTIVGNSGYGTLNLAIRTAATAANNIIAFNAGPAGIWNSDAAIPALRNNDVFGNGAPNYYGVPDPTGTNGNISQDPLFVDRRAGDLHPQATSPCIDGGDDSVVTPGETDLDGQPRISGSRVDIGSYEFASPIPLTRSDVASALNIAAGALAGTPGAMVRLNPDAPSDRVDLLDAVRLARRVAGLDANP